MIYYPIQTLVDSGITDIMLVCGGNASGEFLRVIENGEEFGLKDIAYTYQKEANGIAHALALAETWANDEPICVVLADNILERPFPKAVEEFTAKTEGARIFLTQVERPEWYGVVTLDEDDNVIEIIEKPKEPKSNWIAIGVYMYDGSVWELIRSLKPSARNELEITDLNMIYHDRGQLKANKIDGWWTDAGESIDTYLASCVKVAELSKAK
jgi:glucose-1-phosphate thymidylyltransferase